MIKVDLVRERMVLKQKLMLILVGTILSSVTERCRGLEQHDYGDALRKSILFFEGQRSGKLPPTQRMNWRKDSALQDGFQGADSIVSHFFDKVDLVGGYYDAGDNVKFNFPMAFSTTMLAWSAIEFGKFMGSEDLKHALDAIHWGTDYLLKATSIPGFVFAVVGDPHGDHNCWERPEDMDTARTAFAVSKEYPGSEVSAEIAAALAASSIVFRKYHLGYSQRLLQRAIMVFKFADKYRGSYNVSLGPWVCPFYCDFSGYQDELVWAAAWLFKATRVPYYLDYIEQNIHNVRNFGEFGWDSKDAGINVLVSKLLINISTSNPFTLNANRFVCAVLPESHSVSVSYSPGGLLFKSGGSNLQHATSFSFLFLVYASYLKNINKQIDCGNGVYASAKRLRQVAKGQVDYILGSNPMNMSYMVGYGPKFPERIHHRASSLPSIDQHRFHIDCKGGSPYFESPNPNPNLLVGAVVGGPDMKDSYTDSRSDFVHSEPTTYINAPLVGVLAYFSSHPNSMS